MDKVKGMPWRALGCTSKLEALALCSGYSFVTSCLHSFTPNHRWVEQEELTPGGLFPLRVQSRTPQLLSLRSSRTAELSLPPCELSIRVSLLQLVAKLVAPELCHLILSPGHALEGAATHSKQRTSTKWVVVAFCRTMRSRARNFSLPSAPDGQWG